MGVNGNTFVKLSKVAGTERMQMKQSNTPHPVATR